MPVQAFVREPLTERAVSDQAGDDAVRRLPLAGERGANADGSHPALHAVAMEVPEREVLTPADSPADASRPMTSAISARITRVGQEVSVVAVIREHGVIRVCERTHDRRLTEFLPEAGVRGAG